MDFLSGVCGLSERGLWIFWAGSVDFLGGDCGLSEWDCGLSERDCGLSKRARGKFLR